MLVDVRLYLVFKVLSDLAPVMCFKLDQFIALPLMHCITIDALHYHMHCITSVQVIYEWVDFSGLHMTWIKWQKMHGYCQNSDTYR